MRLRYFIIKCLTIAVFSTSAQEIRQNISLTGFARLEIGVPSAHFTSNFSCGINFGFHREIKVANSFFADIAFQPGITLYQRGLGTSVLEYTETDQKIKWMSV